MQVPVAPYTINCSDARRIPIVTNGGLLPFSANGKNMDGGDYPHPLLKACASLCRTWEIRIIEKNNSYYTWQIKKFI